MKENNLKNTYFLAYGAVIAAIYVALTMAFQPISFGPVQFRISEALCILPFFTPAAIPGLFVGCFLSNLFCGAAGLDIVFGSLATLIGAVGSYALRKSKVLVCVPPILANTIIVPWVLRVWQMRTAGLSAEVPDNAHREAPVRRHGWRRVSGSEV